MRSLEQIEEEFLESLDKLRLLSEEYFGPKCAEYSPGCVTCLVWRCLEDLESSVMR